jgi:arabinofuranosyltransferase
MMVCWSQALRGHQDSTARNAVSPVFDGALAFVAGLSVLVRPELALVGGLALLMMLVAARGWRRRVLIVAAGGLLPVAYQIFRMGYYGLLVPQTALAKDASGNKWAHGWLYLTNFDEPYLLWVPAVLLTALALILLITRSRQWWIRRPVPYGYSRLARMIQSPPAVVLFIVVSGLLQAVYWIRQGGDFMHGRVLLTPMFLLVAPVAVIPVLLPDGEKFSRGIGYQLAGITSVLWLAVVGWSLWAANAPGMGPDATRVTYSGIVDERRFYSQATGHAHPLTAADYLDYPRMRAVLVALNNTPDGALLLPSGNYDVWDVVPAIPPPPDTPPEVRKAYIGPHTVFFTNLGMLGMNVGLDVRVIDQIGLANPIAAHTARLEDGRIGHDKNLFPDWAVAEGPFLKKPPYIPPYLDKDWIAQAEEALKCPATESMLSSIRGSMGPRRFLSNVLHAYEFTKYRIDRVPMYELIRCGLPIPPPSVPAYTGLPATGP